MIRKITLNHMKKNKIKDFALIYSDPGEKKTAQEFGDKLGALIGLKPAFIESIAPVVGVNAGPGTVAVMYMFE